MQVCLRVENVSKSTLLGENIKIADSSLRRMVGLLGTSHLEPQSGLLIFPTQGVHTFGMKYPIDIVFLDRERRVLGVRAAVKPWRLSPIFWRAQCVVELPAGVIEATRTEVGDQLTWGAAGQRS
jgi:uncharacterized membrane protein (UPF0127 family)